MELLLLVISIFEDKVIFSRAVWTMPTLALIVSIYVLSQKSGTDKKGFLGSLLLKAGDISFELFLVHQLIIRYAEKLAEKLGADVKIAYGVSLVLSFAAAEIIHKAYPALMKKNRT